MRFEGKHKDFKRVARKGSFKNILKTLSFQHQRLMAYNLYYNNLLAAVQVSTGSSKSVHIIMICSAGTCNNYVFNIQHVLFLLFCHYPTLMC